MVIKERNKRIAVFASYSEDNRIADYVIYYLKALRKVVDGIIFVSDNEMEKGETDKLSGIVSKAICHRHGMYDFGSYRIGYFWALEHGLPMIHAMDLSFLLRQCLMAWIRSLVTFGDCWIRMKQHIICCRSSSFSGRMFSLLRCSITLYPVL